VIEFPLNNEISPPSAALPEESLLPALKVKLPPFPDFELPTNITILPLPLDKDSPVDINKSPELPPLASPVHIEIVPLAPLEAGDTKVRFPLEPALLLDLAPTPLAIKISPPSEDAEAPAVREISDPIPLPLEPTSKEIDPAVPCDAAPDSIETDPDVDCVLSPVLSKR